MSDVEVSYSGAELIAIERARQAFIEGWTPEHDDEHEDGELARAAACYADPVPWHPVPPRWPWERRWWKPSPEDRVRELMKAGALIAAEIDRLQRQAAAK